MVRGFEGYTPNVNQVPQAIETNNCDYDGNFLLVETVHGKNLFSSTFFYKSCHIYVRKFRVYSLSL